VWTAVRCRHLRSASRHQLTVPCVRGCHLFASAGPTVWNSLPDNPRNPAVGPDQLRRNLKPTCCRQRFVDSALRVFYVFALYKCAFTYLQVLRQKKNPLALAIDKPGVDPLSRKPGYAPVFDVGLAHGVLAVVFSYATSSSELAECPIAPRQVCEREICNCVCV